MVLWTEASLETWVAGPRTLARTTDGGEHWHAVEAPFKISGIHERLRIMDGSVAVLGPDGFTTTNDGGSSWNFQRMRGVAIFDIVDGFVVGEWDDEMGVAKPGEPVPYSGLPKGIFPIRLARQGSVLRVLSRLADPRGGTGMAVHRSENNGESWRHLSLSLSPKVDIAGENWGLGTDVLGGIYVTK